jgi:Transposase IS4
MFAIEQQGGKDSPAGRPPHPTNEKGKAIGLLLRLCDHLFGSGHCVVFDSGLCLLKAIVELRRNGVYAVALVKKRKYWPKHMQGQRQRPWTYGRSTWYPQGYTIHSIRFKGAEVCACYDEQDARERDKA